MLIGLLDVWLLVLGKNWPGRPMNWLWQRKCLRLVEQDVLVADATQLVVEIGGRRFEMHRLEHCTITNHSY